MTFATLLVVAIGSAALGFTAAMFIARAIIRQHERDAPDVPQC